MHFKHRRRLSAVLAALMSALMLSAPAAAVTEHSDQTDLNQDGYIDVFDFLLEKRASVTAPMSLSISSAEGCPGELVTLCASISNNPGFSYASIMLRYPAELKLETKEISPDSEDEILAEQDAQVLNIKTAGAVLFNSQSASYTEENGTLVFVTFRIPEDAVPGTVYTISYGNSEMVFQGQSLPMLTERGKITVLEPEFPPETTTATTTTTSATTTTTTTTTIPETTVPETTTEPTTVTTTTTTSTTTTTTTTTPTTTTVTTTAPPVKTTPAVTTTRIRNGIDISQWQGNVNFNAIKTQSKTEFIIVRAGYGKYATQEDPNFQTYYNGAKSVGIPVGAYWYSYAMSPEEARLEANVCAKVIAGKQFEYPIAFDIEEQKVFALGKEKVSDIIRAFCSEMEKQGYFAQVYASASPIVHLFDDDVKTRYDIWVAHYNVERPMYTGQYGIWQYGIGTCPGINGDCDMDYGYRDYPSVIVPRHFNGF